MLFSLLIILSNCNIISGDMDAVPLPQPVENLLQSDSIRNERGTWYLGATSHDVHTSAHPIVFVQGLKSHAEEWWGNTEYHGVNDMYELAYHSGYRTAFVELHDVERGPLDQYDNGKLLAKLLKKIYDHFGEKVNIVAHSKGGVDTQTAATHYGAHQYIDKIITIASPHKGTHLANLFYSWYGNWIVHALDSNGAGTYSMQTGQMARFREETDRHPNVLKNRYYTISGTSWGPKPSVLWCGGAYLSQYGDNDGLINEWSTHLSSNYAKHIFTGGFDHDLLRKGSAVWERIEPVLSGRENSQIFNNLAFLIPEVWAGVGEEKQQAFTENDQYITGGELTKGRTVEKEVVLDNPKQALFTVYTSSADVGITLHSPSGKEYTKESATYFSCKQDSLLSGAHVQAFSISHPEDGKWRIQLKGNRKGAYLFTTSLVGKHTIDVNVSSEIHKEGVPMSIRLKNEKLNSTMQVKMKIVGPDQKREERQFNINKAGKENLFKGDIHIGKKHGLYNISFEIRKKTKLGVVERTVNRSIYVR